MKFVCLFVFYCILDFELQLRYCEPGHMGSLLIKYKHREHKACANSSGSSRGRDKMWETRVSTLGRACAWGEGGTFRSVFISLVPYKFHYLYFCAFSFGGNTNIKTNWKTNKQTLTFINFAIQELEDFTMEPLAFHRLFLLHYLEINEDHSNENRQRLFILSLLERRQSAILTCFWQETPRQSGELESFIMDKREGFRGAQVEAVSSGKAVDRLTLPWGS